MCDKLPSPSTWENRSTGLLYPESLLGDLPNLKKIEFLENVTAITKKNCRIGRRHHSNTHN